MTYSHAVSLINDDQPTFILRVISSANLRERLGSLHIEFLGLDKLFLWPDGIIREEVTCEHPAWTNSEPYLFLNNLKKCIECGETAPTQIVGRCIGCFHDFSKGPCGGCGAVKGEYDTDRADGTNG